MKESFDDVTVRSTRAIIGLNPNGEYVTSWNVIDPTTNEGKSILYQGSSIKRTGIPILFPQFGTAPTMTKHGFGRSSLWEIQQKTSDMIQMILTNKDISEEAKKEFPYPFEAISTVTAEGSGSLLYAVSVKNPGETPLPIAPGLHPYWAIDHAQKKSVTINGITGFDAKAYDWDHTPPDIAFEYSGLVVIHFSKWDISIEDVTPHQSVIRHIVVWSQPITMEDYNYICVEPVCGYNDDLVNNPIIVAPHQEWNMTVRFSVALR